MSTFQDFENAPVGATARRPGSPVAVKVSFRPTTKGNWDDGLVKMSPETLVDYDYILDPEPTPAPTTAREALDLAWNLAYPIKEGRFIPEGVRYVRRSQDGGLVTLTAAGDWTPDPRHRDGVRTLDRLPEPVPDWLDAPAVLASCRYSDVTREGVFTPSSVHTDRWVLAGTVGAMHWSELRDVTPLYPEGEKE